MRLSVSDGSERFAVQYDTAQTDQMFSSLGILLSEALSSAAAPSEVTEQAWRDALCAPGVWFDFLGDIPLEALYAWMVEGGEQSQPHRRRPAGGRGPGRWRRGLPVLS